MRRSFVDLSQQKAVPQMRRSFIDTRPGAQVQSIRYGGSLLDYSTNWSVPQQWGLGAVQETNLAILRQVRQRVRAVWPRIYNNRTIVNINELGAILNELKLDGSIPALRYIQDQEVIKFVLEADVHKSTNISQDEFANGLCRQLLRYQAQWQVSGVSVQPHFDNWSSWSVPTSWGYSGLSAHTEQIIRQSRQRAYDVWTRLFGSRDRIGINEVRPLIEQLRADQGFTYFSHISVEEIINFVNQVDTNRDGLISFQEFADALSRQLLRSHNSWATVQPAVNTLTTSQFISHNHVDHWTNWTPPTQWGQQSLHTDHLELIRQTRRKAYDLWYRTFGNRDRVPHEETRLLLQQLHNDTHFSQFGGIRADEVLKFLAEHHHTRDGFISFQEFADGLCRQLINYQDRWVLPQRVVLSEPGKVVGVRVATDVNVRREEGFTRPSESIVYVPTNRKIGKEITIVDLWSNWAPVESWKWALSAYQLACLRNIRKKAYEFWQKLYPSRPSLTLGEVETLLSALHKEFQQAVHKHFSSQEVLHQITHHEQNSESQVTVQAFLDALCRHLGESASHWAIEGHHIFVGDHDIIVTNRPLPIQRSPRSEAVIRTLTASFLRTLTAIHPLSALRILTASSFRILTASSSSAQPLISNRVVVQTYNDTHIFGQLSGLVLDNQQLGLLREKRNRVENIWLREFGHRDFIQYQELDRLISAVKREEDVALIRFISIPEILKNVIGVTADRIGRPEFLDGYVKHLAQHINLWFQRVTYRPSTPECSLSVVASLSLSLSVVASSSLIPRILAPPSHTRSSPPNQLVA